jgi:glycosyltransferase involved in cell wall biosynthesis
MEGVVKIAQVAPLIESVPPGQYGGTERVVSYLTEELIKQGHDVTLFASGDSETEAELVACCPKALRRCPGCLDPLAWHILQMEKVMRRAEEFDVIHFHNDYLHFPLSSRMQTPHITTLHGRLDLPILPVVHEAFPNVPLVSISDAQRIPLPEVNWRATVYHGLPNACFLNQDDQTEHLTFLGRISPEKGLDRAIEIALAVELPLVIAAKIDRVDQEYFDSKIAKLLDHPLITFIGEVEEAEKPELFKKTHALLFPINWPEPFGLVMIEAMARGVPVIAFERGSVPEVIDHGKTGFVVNTVEEAVAAVGAIPAIKRSECREIALRRFNVSRMANEYVREYQRLVDREDRPSEEFELTSA